MPHRAEAPPHPPPPHIYNHPPHVVPPMMRGRPHPAHPRGSPPMHMMHPSEAARMAAYHRARAYPPPPPPHHPGAHRGGPPHHAPMWHHHPDAAAHHPDAAAAHHLDAAAVHHHARVVHPDHAMSRHEHAPHKHAAAAAPEQAPPNHTEEEGVQTAEETAASALLMASSVPRASPTAGEAKTEGEEQPTDEDGAPATKKRKKQLDVLRRNTQETTSATGQPCHVSPMSTASLGSHATTEGPRSDDAASIVTQSSRTPTMLHESSSGSYDMRDEAKKKEATTPTTNVPPQHVEVLHFPSILHEVLNSSDANTVLQWLPHGQAWKIVRWDALRREVLPRYFPNLKDGSKGEGGSIDAFLYNVRAWGFEEIKDGPDVGAYRHMFFLQGVPKLCKRMTSSAGVSSEENSPNPKDEATPVDSHPHQGAQKTKAVSDLILRVPSLGATTRSADGEQHVKEAMVQHPVAAGERSPVVHHGWPPHAYQDGYSGHHHPPESPMQHQRVTTFPPAYSPRFPFRAHPASPTVRSGRGGSRVGATLGKSNRTQDGKSSSFPVSQRGKGNRARVGRTVGATDSAAPAETTTGEEPEIQRQETQSPAPEPEKDSTASAVSRKMKRKLPLARNHSGTLKNDDNEMKIAEV